LQSVLFNQSLFGRSSYDARCEEFVKLLQIKRKSATK